MRIPVCLLAFVVAAHGAAVGAQPAPDAARTPLSRSNHAGPAIGRGQRLASITGTVYDSLLGAPVRAAGVQLVSADASVPHGQTVTTDDRGRYVMRNVPLGRYTIGFFHPKLDSLGLAPMAESLAVSEPTDMHRDLAIPSAPRIRAALCGSASSNRAGAVLMGIVRDARTGDPVSGATVAVEWTEFVLGKNQLGRRTPRTTVTSGDNGWFAFCHVPSPGTVVLVANRGNDSTDFVESQLAGDGFRRHELFVGPARTRIEPAAAGVPVSDDSTALPPRVVHLGDGRVRGTVRHASTGRPLANIQVGIVNGPQTRTNSRGEWELANAPEGTRRLEVRGVGFYPDRQTINVIADAAPVDASLATLRSVLDTVKVTARYAKYSSFNEFTERARTGVGRYITAEDIARRKPVFLTDLLRIIPGLWVDGVGGTGDTGVSMRGIFSSRCSPNVVMNGFVIPGLFAADINAAMYPEDVLGIEIYRAGLVPPQFTIGPSDCGAIVIWTK
jgi:hypothetical protein